MKAVRKKRGFAKNSLSPEILRLHNEGMTQSEIARQLGCGQTAVSWVIRHYAGGTRVIIDGMPQEQIQWLRSEAAAHRVSIGDMARAMLADAIAEAKDGGVHP